MVQPEDDSSAALKSSQSIQSVSMSAPVKQYPGGNAITLEPTDNPFNMFASPAPGGTAAPSFNSFSTSTRASTSDDKAKSPQTSHPMSDFGKTPSNSAPTPSSTEGQFRPLFPRAQTSGRSLPKDFFNSSIHVENAVWAKKVYYEQKQLKDAYEAYAKSHTANNGPVPEAISIQFKYLIMTGEAAIKLLEEVDAYEPPTFLFSTPAKRLAETISNDTLLLIGLLQEAMKKIMTFEEKVKFL
jgi:hypothetical protein